MTPTEYRNLFSFPDIPKSIPALRISDLDKFVDSHIKILASEKVKPRFKEIHQRRLNYVVKYLQHNR